MTVSIWQADHQQPVRDVDFLVVGAGLIGCTTAYFASQQGHDVVITDMQHIGLGASSRNAGFMITGMDTYYHRAIEIYGRDLTDWMWKLSNRTHEIWHQFASKGNVPLVNSGSLLLSESQAEKDEIKLAYEALRADGHQAIYHDTDPLKRGYFSAIEQPQDCAVQPYKLINAIFEQSGAELVANNELYAIEQTEEDYVMVYTRQFAFRAKHVMLCTNAYSHNIHPYFVGKVIPNRAQVLVTEPLDQSLIPSCGYSDYGYMYYRMTFDNRFLVGGARNLYKELEGDTTDDRVNAQVQGALDDYCRKYFPETIGADGQVKVHRRWAGIMGFTPDSIPLVGTLPNMPKVGYAVGFTGHGLAMGGGTAEIAVNHLLNGADAHYLHSKRLD